ncbi:MAG: hypothetical protein ACTSWL_08480 [Promethearchaeota archaeon]
MYSTQINVGDCPFCGDELYIFKTKSRKRLVKCINEDCPKEYVYPIPKSGKVEVTGGICPKNNLPILAIIPNLVVATGKYRKRKKSTYFWTDGPCFSCSKQSKCENLAEIKEDYD